MRAAASRATSAAAISRRTSGPPTPRTTRPWCAGSCARRRPATPSCSWARAIRSCRGSRARCSPRSVDDAAPVRAPRSVLGGAPHTDAAEALGRDARDEAGLIAKLWRREVDAGTEIATRELLQQRHGAPFGDPRTAVHDDVLAQAHRAERVGQHRERHARIVANVLRLAPLTHVADD